jgi:hypothetical protein
MVRDVLKNAADQEIYALARTVRNYMVAARYPRTDEQFLVRTKRNVKMAHKEKESGRNNWSQLC